MQKKRISVKGILGILKKSFNGFLDDRVTALSGSLAYSTVFSLGPLLIVIISLCGLFFAREAIEGEIYGALVGFVGQDTATQLQEIIKNASLSGKSPTAAIVGGITLLIGATAIFSEIQSSINVIWGIKPKPKKGWLMFLKNRVLSFSIIVSLGFLLLVSLGINTLVDILNDQLKSMFPDVAVVIFYILNLVITLLITATIFGVIFKVLPDADVKWKDVAPGAVATAVLFMLGKAAISFYISKSSVGSTYGAAGSLVVLLVWVYYSSIILYFGAEFTKHFATKYGLPIHPNEYSVSTQMVEIEKGNTPVQENDKVKINSENPGEQIAELHAT
jgi:membrane protein